MKLSRSLRSVLIMLICAQTGLMSRAFAQDCTGFSATATPFESRCTATGSMKIKATGGSGTYNYKVSGPVSTDFTSSSTITGLPPGTYTVTIKDIVSGCIDSIINEVITGSYKDPRFGITETDVTCVNGNDGTLSVTGVTDGRGPFVFTIVAPSAGGIGSTNGTGTFTGLAPGSYTMQMTDSCGGLQTRNISVSNYSWSITSYSFPLTFCTVYQANLGLTDSKGNTNASGTAFNGFLYGYVNAPGDTVWGTAHSFPVDIGQKRKITLVAKDRCGLVKSKPWTNPSIPSVATNVTITNPTCTGFDAKMTGQQNLTNPVYCITDGSGNGVSGQPCNYTGVFTNLPYGSYCITEYNSCYDTTIKRCFSQTHAQPLITGSVVNSNYTCTTFTGTVTGQQNLINPTYCLFDGNNNSVAGQPCNNTGVFSNVAYGNYYIMVTDGCTGTQLKVFMMASKPTASVGGSISTGNYSCSGFTATVTGQSNLNSPQYCLLDSVGNTIVCNTTGVFNNLPYGSYCINITSGCGDTTIKRCFTATQPPITGGGPAVSNIGCSGYTLTISGTANMFNGLYCLQDSTGNPIAGIPCNTTGIFNNVPYGKVCVKATDGCAGNNTLLSCGTMVRPVPSVGPAVISNQTCNGFTATISNQQNLYSPVFCLYDAGNNQIGSCNNTGVFAVTQFGDFHVLTTDGCTGTVFRTDFTVNKQVSSVGSAVNLSNQSCTTFSAAMTGQVNLTAASYTLKNSSGVVQATNSTGVFDNIPYGDYCIDVTNSCGDTTIERCFSVLPNATQMTVTATPSCTYDASDLNIDVSSGIAPFNVKIYDGNNNLVKDTTTSNSNITIYSLPEDQTGLGYKVVVNAACGSPATQTIRDNPSLLNHDYDITPKCPSSLKPTGSGDLSAYVTTNIFGVQLKIVAKDFVPISQGYSYRSGNTYTFSNLDAAVYVIKYTFTSCTTVIYDTVSIPPYGFPSLGQSAAYQCDNNSFSVGAAVSGGVDPFTYQIIGSVPNLPSLNSPAQASPVFSITNGVEYSLVRLRAIDACGNAALNDVSILPLANTIVTATSTCIHQNTTLSTDDVPNATYMWYRKTNIGATDSTLVGTDRLLTLTDLTPSDTGIYVSRMSVNSGCLTKLSYFHLDGTCNIILPNAVRLTGRALNAGNNQLSWTADAGGGYRQFVLERKKADGTFEMIGAVNALAGTSTYNYIDKSFTGTKNDYRLRLVMADGQTRFTNIVTIGSGGNESGISVYPNPVDNVLHISIDGSGADRYQAVLFNAGGQMIYNATTGAGGHNLLTYNRTNAAKGIYFLKVNNLGTGVTTTFKVIFK